MRILRKTIIPTEDSPRFVDYHDEDEGTDLELTYNWAQEESYEKGTAWGHLADNWYR